MNTVLQVALFLLATACGIAGVFFQTPWAASVGQAAAFLLGLWVGVEKGPEMTARWKALRATSGEQRK